MSTWGIIPYCQSAETAEAISVLEGIKTIIPMEPNPVVVECDNITVVNDLKASEGNRSQISFILAEARDLLTLLPGYKIQKVNRANNRVAHELARFGRSAWSGGVLMSTTPTCVLDSAQRDCNDSCKRNSVV
jgi:hypothetical protein